MQIELYTWLTCPYCQRAKALLKRRGLPFKEHVMDGRDAELAEVKRRYQHPTVPIVLIDGLLIGGCDNLEALERSGGLGPKA
jgi:glutaredoxin 3